LEPRLAAAGPIEGNRAGVVGFVIVQLLLFIVRAPHVDADVLSAGLAGYLMLAILWTLAYLLVAQTVPGAFAINSQPAKGPMDSFTALYFSFTVLSTVGFGDIVPVARVARLLAVIEATTGLFYLTVLIARLVGLYSPKVPTNGMRHETRERSE